MAQDAQKLPDYGTPPLSEVACGIVFEPLKEMKVPHFGLFWNRVIDDFPTAQHAPPLGEGPDQIVDPMNFPLPRVWLVSKSENVLIQLQNDRLIFNWRKMGDGDEYPRFEYVFDSFQKYLEQFSNFLDEYDIGTIKPKECELTYINHILEGEGWEGTGQIGNIVRDVRWSDDKEFLTPPDIINWQGVFNFPENKGAMNVTLRQGMRRTDNRRLYMLELNTKGIEPGASEASDTWPWYHLAHEWIVKGFTDLTNKDTQNELWNRK